MNDDQELSVRDQVVRLLRLPEVESRVGLKRSKIYKLISQAKFPRPVQLGGPRSVGWPSNLVDAWIQERIDAAYQRTPSTVSTTTEARA